MRIRSRLTASASTIDERTVTVKLPFIHDRSQRGMADSLSPETGMRADDRRLGMDRPIARRDFLNGVAIGAGAIVGGMWPGVLMEGLANEAAARRQQSDYPRSPFSAYLH
jgi:hypothetical protein